MLKKIPKILSPELLKVLMEMGHGDEIVLADGNFPAVTCGQRVVRCDGHGIPELLDAILELLPLDVKYSDKPVGLMEVMAGDSYQPVIWQTYNEILARHENPAPQIDYIERFAFYEKAKKAFAVVTTGEGALYANILLKKGVVV
ncbi:L-fucose mutarotase [Hydrogenoanaerobacterium saccharovorans]|uniref:L-fucose mutarotase n=1 Tax=Hydrogenoanaerobacterium saccharovorans TaxID=474960 RepID=A0A1H7YWJ7_9FIRM|nr:L-fucose mutarotase [Hydrogenoanaerobacterium saccharovorans]RPF48972.1 L-fucose mutarotase [Hydrogenoanaerobacterium saccharovorans]SEM50325.1 L-fucose mutarotase [Hydrogenoanaerobacterium saccharovorans]